MYTTINMQILIGKWVCKKCRPLIKIPVTRKLAIHIFHICKIIIPTVVYNVFISRQNIVTSKVPDGSNFKLHGFNDHLNIILNNIALLPVYYMIRDR